ncbi:MAG: hypothetical protein LBV53_02770 [Mycoplasmataceae bacterium]|jgi:hypothetical protein|nr:hypothetical protein [Mycoplasmataceae bacterium]
MELIFNKQDGNITITEKVITNVVTNLINRLTDSKDNAVSLEKVGNEEIINILIKKSENKIELNYFQNLLEEIKRQISYNLNIADPKIVIKY